VFTISSERDYLWWTNIGRANQREFFVQLISNQRPSNRNSFVPSVHLHKYLHISLISGCLYIHRHPTDVL
jgi:hypothetical protein